MDHESVERIEERAQKLVGASLFLLAVYIAGDAVLALWHRDRPGPSVVGICLTVVSLFVMVWLARAKRRAAAALGSRALQADAFQTTAYYEVGGRRAVDDHNLWTEPLAAPGWRPLGGPTTRQATATLPQRA